MTEDEARANLESAIGDWTQARYPEDGDLVCGWVLLTELVSADGKASFDTSSSQGLGVVREIGLCDAARHIALASITKASD